MTMLRRKKSRLKFKPKYRARSSRYSKYNRLKKPLRVRRSRNKYVPHMGKKQLAKLEKRTNDLTGNI